jgi:hypothetical protein
MPKPDLPGSVLVWGFAGEHRPALGADLLGEELRRVLLQQRLPGIGELEETGVSAWAEYQARPCGT